MKSVNYKISGSGDVSVFDNDNARKAMEALNVKVDSRNNKVYFRVVAVVEENGGGDVVFSTSRKNSKGEDVEYEFPLIMNQLYTSEYKASFDVGKTFLKGSGIVANITITTEIY